MHHDVGRVESSRPANLCSEAQRHRTCLCLRCRCAPELSFGGPRRLDPPYVLALHWALNLMRPGVSDVAPRKTKHISLVVCSPRKTICGGRNGLLGFLSELS